MEIILLFLSLKYWGEWAAIYNSLQKREKLIEQDVIKTIKKVSSNFLTLLDQNYCTNLKTIYRPPFGIYYIGNFDLTKLKTISLIGKLNTANKKYIDFIFQKNIGIIWAYLTKKEITNVLHQYPKNNIFYHFDLAKNYFLLHKKNFTDLLIKNVFISEIWETNNSIDYSQQINERLFCGISKRILIIDDITEQNVSSLTNFANSEEISVNILKNVYLKKAKKFKNIKKINVIENLVQIKTLLE